MVREYVSGRLIRFYLGNFLAWIYELAATFFLVEFSGWWYGTAYAFSLASSILFLFSYYVLYVFDINGKGMRRLRNFIFLTSLIYATSWFLVVLLTENSNIGYVLSIVIVSFFIATFTYRLNEYVVFY